MSKSIRVYAPATVANVSVGFDVMGFSIGEPGDEMEVKMTNSTEIKVFNHSPYNSIPEEANQNVSAISLKAMLSKLGSKQGFELHIMKKIMPGGGLGSSAAASVSSIFGANELLGRPFTNKDLIPFAMEGEKYASGSAHADNVAPALLGGFVLIRSYEELDIVELDFPNNLYCAVVHPMIVVRTEEARKILKPEVPLKDAVKQWANLAGLVVGLSRSDFSLIGRSLDDVIIEPVRSLLIPGFASVKQNAMEEGAIGCGISGSGPSMFAFSNSEEDAYRISAKMKAGFEKLGIESEAFVSRAGENALKVLD